MSWVEDRLRGIERRVEDIYRWMLDLNSQTKANTQQGAASWQQPNQNGGGGGSVYVAAPGSSIAAASAAPAGGTPGGPVSATVYQISGGAYVTFATSQSIYNAMLSATTSGRVLIVLPNPDNTWTAVSQSCT
jgi:hypothetical protein